MGKSKSTGRTDWQAVGRRCVVRERARHAVSLVWALQQNGPKLRERPHKGRFRKIKTPTKDKYVRVNERGKGEEL